MEEDCDYPTLFKREKVSVERICASADQRGEMPNENDLRTAISLLDNFKKGNKLRVNNPSDVYLALASLNLCNRYAKIAGKKQAKKAYRFCKPLAVSLARDLISTPIGGIDCRGAIDRNMLVLYFSVYDIQFSFHCSTKEWMPEWELAQSGDDIFDGVRKQPSAVTVFQRARRLRALGYGK